MNDDDFSGIVRSGAQHSVSVSEHTGNAKNPKNIVASHEEETEARKRAFEEKALAALEAEKALAAALAEHTEHVAPNDGATDANLQKVAATKASANRQGIAGEAAAKPNVQNVSTDAFQTNKQQVNTDKIQDNLQAVANGSALAPNVQSVGSGTMAANPQNIAGDKAIEANRQGVPTDKLVSNVQNIPIGVVAANVQDIGSQSLAPNNQAVTQDSLGINRQGIDNAPAASANLQDLPQDDVAVNRQSLGQDGSATRRQGIPTDGTAANEQQLANLGGQNNTQALQQDSIADNLQAIPQGPGIAPNNQPIGTDAASLNRQAAPQDAPAGPNRQGVDNGKIESHFEQLPSGDVERQKVNFPTGTPSGTGSDGPATSTGNKTSTPVAKPRAPLTTAEQQLQAKLKREQMNEAFHGRLAGIKHNVDALNDRLTDFEDKVHKEDSKLEKGNPEDFDINLD